ncbi:MAG: type II toxin-antitoxin system Phd/YefM family antitoxin [Sulfuricella sp.]
MAHPTKPRMCEKLMEITADQAQAHFSDLLERVSKGEQFAITKGRRMR